jgi:hypothetical protein
VGDAHPAGWVEAQGSDQAAMNYTCGAETGTVTAEMIYLFWENPT